MNERSLRISLAVAAVLALAACGSTPPSATPKTYTGTLTFASFNPFTGPDASFGPEMAAGCIPAAHLINQAGGALATVPIINRAQIPMFGDTGQAAFDKSTYDYFWRLTPPDDAAGIAMAIYAYRKGYRKGAAVFGNDLSSQGNVPNLLAAFSKLGGKIVLNQSIALDKGSYRSEVQALVAANPDVIFTEASPQTNAAYFSQLQQLHGMIPVIGTQPTVQPPWIKAVGGAIG